MGKYGFSFFWKRALAITAIAIQVSVPLLAPVSSFAHGGGLDSLGCHYDRKRGGYHCHRGPLAGRSFNSRAEAERELRKQGKPKEGKESPQKQQKRKQ